MPVYIIMHTCIYVGPMHVHIVHVSMLDEERSIIDINAFMLALRLQYFLTCMYASIFTLLLRSCIHILWIYVIYLRMGLPV